MNWQSLTLSEDRTHFLQHGKVAFHRHFRDALKFHAPGLAPVADEAGWFHLDAHGQDLYAQRYHRSFGFYDSRAAVWASDGWHHLDERGKPLYPARYAWCGNFQQARCPVRESTGQYLHLTTEGKAAYSARYRYAGDFRDGVAAVMRTDGRSIHIRLDGSLLHPHAYLDLGVYHKGYATARDESGCFHIDWQGTPLYASRFAAVEPFYNGFARVKKHGGRAAILSEAGELVREL